MKKRTITLILALVLALCLSVTAFAHNLPNHPTISGGTNASLTILVDGVSTPLFSGTIYGDTLYDGLNTASGVTPVWVSATDYFDHSIIHMALASLNNYASTYGDLSDLGILEDQDGNEYAIYEDWSGSQYIVTEDDYLMDGYYLLGTSVNAQNQTVYHYLYIGKGWTYSDNVSGEIYDYMCDYVLSGQTITMLYALQPTDWYDTIDITA